jgi:hypothetical protein
VRNHFRDQLKYEVQLLENPSRQQIEEAIRLAVSQMNVHVRRCNLVIYYSGYAEGKLSENSSSILT